MKFACRACVVDAHGVLMEFFMPDRHADPGCDGRLNQGQIYGCACASGSFVLSAACSELASALNSVCDNCTSFKRVGFARGLSFVLPDPCCWMALLPLSLESLGCRSLN